MSKRTFTVKASEEAKKHKKLCASKTKRSSCSGADCIESYTMEDKRNAEHPYLYFTKHGVGPGTLPKDVNVMKWEDLDNYMTAIWVDRPLSTEELNQYDIYPETRNGELKKQYGISTSKVTCDEDFDEDPELVFFVNGNLEYQGEFGLEFTNKLIDLCEHDKGMCEELFAFCNAFGDDLLDEGATPREIAETTMDLMIFDYYESEYSENGFYETFEEGFGYSDNESNWPTMECFLASEMA